MHRCARDATAQGLRVPKSRSSLVSLSNLYLVQWTGAIPSRIVTTLCVARSLARNLSYVHPRKTRLVPTYSGGYFTQDTVPSVENRWAFFVWVTVLLCKSIGAIPSHGDRRRFWPWIYGLVYLHIVVEFRYSYIENSMLSTLVPVSNLYRIACAIYVGHA